MNKKFIAFLVAVLAVLSISVGLVIGMAVGKNSVQENSEKPNVVNGFFYPTGDRSEEDKTVYSPPFANLDQCLNWGKEKRDEVDGSKFECGQNCIKLPGNKTFKCN